MTPEPASQLGLWHSSPGAHPSVDPRRRIRKLPAGSPDRSAEPVPRPEDQPTMQLWPEVGKLLGLGRAATYDAARRGDIPTIHFEPPWV